MLLLLLCSESFSSQSSASLTSTPSHESVLLVIVNSFRSALAVCWFISSIAQSSTLMFNVEFIFILASVFLFTAIQNGELLPLRWLHKHPCVRASSFPFPQKEKQHAGT